MKTKAVRMYGEMDLRLEEFELPEIKDDEFLDCIINQNEEKIREKLQFVLKVYFNNYISKI